MERGYGPRGRVWEEFEEFKEFGRACGRVGVSGRSRHSGREWTQKPSLGTSTRSTPSTYAHTPIRVAGACQLPICATCFV
jgi:hypothetical protein